MLICLIVLPMDATAETGLQKKSVGFQQTDSIPALLQSGKIKLSDIPDPHWNKNGCNACHKNTATGASAENLNHMPVEKICNNCHSPAFEHNYIHPVNIKPDKTMLADMTASMRRELAENNNRITCTSCHDLTLQCLDRNRKQKLTNPKFFRGGPYESRSQLCFSCHDKEQYQRLDPHDQIDNQGNIRPEKCYVCHADSVARLKQVRETDQLEFHAGDALSTMCWGCHPWTPHPGGQFTFFKQKSGPNHLIKPPPEIKQRMDEMTEKNQVNFPLEPGSGKIFCATCHNPHEKGVITDPEKAGGSDRRKRLRASNICEYCHIK